jgi:4-oxalocrotonate tautomerase family enzyme
MPLITIKTMKGCSKEAIEKTMKEINHIVSQNLGYDPAHVWVFTEEVEHDHFLTAGKTWKELKPLLYASEKDETAAKV